MLRQFIGRHRASLTAGAIYLVIGLFMLLEQWGKATNDTRLELVEAPWDLLANSFSLWNPRVSLGELQNQAYGYLFPQGTFFALWDWLSVPGWVTERVWSWLLVVIAAEGLRRVARAMSVNPWAALLAGLAYALTPRHVAEIGVRSADILPSVMIPWALLPVVLLIQRRLRPLPAAVLSAAAFACGGGINGTVTAAPVGLLAVFVLWGWFTRRLGWKFVLIYSGTMLAANLWWAVSLLRLGAYSPPFYDFVEDARNTTSSAGFSNAFRGVSNWVNFITVDGSAWWPAGYQLVSSPWLIAATAVLAGAGLVGLLCAPRDWRVPLVISAGFGLTCMSIAHTGDLTGPFAEQLQTALDHALAPLRNVTKADPVLRVPLGLGFAFLLHQLMRQASRDPERDARRRLRVRWAPVRRTVAGLTVAALAAGVVLAAAPVLQRNLRTPGWEALPDYWVDAAAYLDESPLQGTAWVVPGSGFALQDWGWSMEEPMQVVGTTSWVSRSQVPLTPPATIRMLSSLEKYLETGAGSPYLRNMLERMGVDRVVVRHDLDQGVSQSTNPNLVSVALARSPGIRRVATFGRLDFGPAVEIFDVENSFGGLPDTQPTYRIRDLDDAVSIAGSVEDANLAVGAGFVGDDQPMFVQGDTGWRGPAHIQGDQFQRRERNFGRVHQAESNIMSPDDHYRMGRVVPNYPGPDGAEEVVARYRGIADITASSSAGYADVIGAIRPETAPWAVLDGDDSTYWQPAPYAEPVGQWVQIDFRRPQRIDTVLLQQPTSTPGLSGATTWTVSAGGVSDTVKADPFDGKAVAHLGGVEATELKIEVTDLDRFDNPPALASVTLPGLSVDRTLALPAAGLTAYPDFVFASQPETRPCVTTLLGPDCSFLRMTPSEEATGIDRTFTVPVDGRWRLGGTAVARADRATLELLQPDVFRQTNASSWFGFDPSISPRMADDGERTTSWIADPRDREPRLYLNFGEQRTVRSLKIDPPTGSIGTVPTRAVIRGGKEVRVVDTPALWTRFKPFEASRVSVTFSRSDKDWSALGVSEIKLGPERVAVPIDGAEVTGADCGEGPPLTIDDTTYRTRVRGPLGNVTADGQFAVQLCRDDIELEAGRHRLHLESTNQFQPVTLRMRSQDQVRDPVAPSRLLVEKSVDKTEVVLDVSAGDAAVISAPQNYNSGWTATADGEELESVQVDGWSQGWILPSGDATEVVLTFTPQRGYLQGLVGGLVLLGLLVIGALAYLVLLAVRPRWVRPAGPEVPFDLRATRPSLYVRSGRWVRLVLAVLVIAVVVGIAWVVGGWVTAAGAFVGLVLGGRRWWAGLLTVGLLTTSLVLQLQQLDDQLMPSATMDALVGAAAALALAAGLTARVRADYPRRLLRWLGRGLRRGWRALRRLPGAVRRRVRDAR